MTRHNEGMSLAEVLAVIDGLFNAQAPGAGPSRDLVLKARAAVAALVERFNNVERECEALKVELAEMTADRDSWSQQAADRTDDAVVFAQQADALKAERDALREVAVIAGRVRLTDWLNAGGTVAQQDYCAALAGAGHVE